MSKKKSAFNFEESLHELESLVSKLEDGDLSLEESLSAFEQGIKLTKSCQQHLSAAEQKVSLLIGDDDDLQVVDLDEDQDD
ncbi:MAG: exodeoxyribonuclease VII small subunit [Cellvibrionaceae bacterium]